MADFNSAYTGTQIDAVLGKLQSALTVVNGGTGATTAEKARENLGITKANLGLDKVDNTADSAKSVASAAKLTTGRTLSASGDATGTSAAFDGSANATIPLTLATVNSAPGSFGPAAAASPGFGGSFNVPQVTVDAKGRATAVANRAITLPAAPTAADMGAVPETRTVNGQALTEDITLTPADVAAFGGNGTVTTGSFNDLRQVGCYWINAANMTDGPSSGFGHLLVFHPGNEATTDGNTVQVYINYANQTTWVRTYTNNQWYDWVQMMPATGGAFTGNATAYTTNRSNTGLRNILVVNSSGTAVPTNQINMWRK